MRFGLFNKYNRFYAIFANFNTIYLFLCYISSKTSNLHFPKNTKNPKSMKNNQISIKLVSKASINVKLRPGKVWMAVLKNCALLAKKLRCLRKNYLIVFKMAFILNQKNEFRKCAVLLEMLFPVFFDSGHKGSWPAIQETIVNILVSSFIKRKGYYKKFFENIF